MVANGHLKTPFLPINFEVPFLHQCHVAPGLFTITRIGILERMSDIRSVSDVVRTFFQI